MPRVVCTYCGEQLPAVTQLSTDEELREDLKKTDDPEVPLGICSECRQSIQGNREDLRRWNNEEKKQTAAGRWVLLVGCAVIAIWFAVLLAFDIAKWLRSWFFFT